MKANTSQLHQLTVEYMDKTDIDYRKSKGQYFTPKDVRERLLSKLPNNFKSPKILDPSCGSGEFLISAKQYFHSPKLYGWDIDKNLVKIAKRIIPNAELKAIDTLKEHVDERFDFVIGNPPYYEFTPDIEIRERFGEIINGRLNIFSLFIKLGIDLLKDGGYLAYVVPPSMNNGAYFSTLRQFIVKNSNIESLEILEKTDIFQKALQKIMLIILKKEKNKGSYLFEKNGIQIFTPKPEYLRKAFGETVSLKDLGCTVRTGRLVWNQCKDLLTNDSKEGIPLIWSHNITSEGLKIPIKNKKPQYIKKSDYDVGPAIVVNRITGAAGSARIKAAIIPKGMKFIGENHVNVIFPSKLKNTTGKEINLKILLTQLRLKEKLEVIQNITGNTQLSKTELENLFPISINSLGLKKH